MKHQEYLYALVAELMEDKEWELPQDCRFFLDVDLVWSLLNL